MYSNIISKSSSISALVSIGAVVGLLLVLAGSIEDGGVVNRELTLLGRIKWPGREVIERKIYIPLI